MRKTTQHALTAVVALLLTSTAGAGTSNSLMDISADGTLLACSNRDSGTVTIIDTVSSRKLREVRVGTHPEGVSFLGDSHRLGIAVYGDDRVLFVDADSGHVEASVEVFDEPYGIVSDRRGTRVFVTLDFPGRLVEINTSNHVLTRELTVGRFVRGIAIDDKDDRVFVTEYYTSTVKAIGLTSWKIDDEWSGGRTDNLSRQLILNPKRPKAYLPHIRSRVTANHGSGSIFPYVSIVDTAAGEGKRRSRIPIDTVFSVQITSNAWEIDVSPDATQLYIVFAGTNDMFACNIVDDDYRELSLRKRIALGANPRAVCVSPDSRTVYVYNALDFNVAAYDSVSLRKQTTIAVTENPLTNEILRGKKLFHTALQPMASRRWISCSSCHPDGEPDARTWHNPEGLRNTQSLAGIRWTHPIHWSADRDEVHDFEHTIRGPLMQGDGLVHGHLHDSLDQSNAGLSADLDALAAYTNSHTVSLSPFAKQGLSTSAKRGRELFFSAKTKCSTCHSGPYFAGQPMALDSQISHGEEIRFVRYNVGTGDDDPSEEMGPAYDTPTLLGIYRTAPYLHHGKAATLLDVLTTQNRDDRHGVTSHLNTNDLHALVDFLKALPYEIPNTDVR